MSSINQKSLKALLKAIFKKSFKISNVTRFSGVAKNGASMKKWIL